MCDPPRPSLTSAGRRASGYSSLRFGALTLEMETVIPSIRRLARIEGCAHAQSQPLMSATLTAGAAPFPGHQYFIFYKMRWVGAMQLLPRDGIEVEEIILGDAGISIKPVQI